MNEETTLREGKESAQLAFYDKHKVEFIRFAQKYNMPNEDLIEIYQDACLVVFENAIKGKLESLKSSLKTYLFGVGKFLIYKRFKELQKQSSIAINEEWSEGYFDPFAADENSDKIGLIKSGLQKLGKKCREVLKLYYFEEKELDDIMIIMNYDSKNVLKSQKSRCLKQLKEIMLHNE